MKFETNDSGDVAVMIIALVFMIVVSIAGGCTINKWDVHFIERDQTKAVTK